MQYRIRQFLFTDNNVLVRGSSETQAEVYIPNLTSMLIDESRDVIYLSNGKYMLVIQNQSRTASTDMMKIGNIIMTTVMLTLNDLKIYALHANIPVYSVKDKDITYAASFGGGTLTFEKDNFIIDTN